MALSIAEVAIHSRSTEWFINSDPTMINLIPRSEVMVNGTKKFVDQQPRGNQKFKVIWAGDNGIVREPSPSGGVRRFDFIIVGMPASVVEIGDYWKIGSQQFVIEYVFPSIGYEVKAGGVSHGSKPTGA